MVLLGVWIVVFDLVGLWYTLVVLGVNMFGVFIA